MWEDAIDFRLLGAVLIHVGVLSMLFMFICTNIDFRYKHVVYVDASSISSIKADLQGWVRSLGDGHERDVWEDAFRILEAIPVTEYTALVLDNADDPSIDLVLFLPRHKNITIIITSRNRNVGALSTSHHLELGEMDDDQALSTLLRAARREQSLPESELTSAHSLMRELGNLPLALVQVGTYCHELSSTIGGIFQPYSFTQYLSLFRSNRAELLKQAGPSSLDRYQRGVYTTLDISYKAIPLVSRKVFHALSFFHHDSLSMAALAAAAERNFGDSYVYLPRPESHAEVVLSLKEAFHVNGRWSDLHMHQIIRTLRSFSLLSSTSVDDIVFLQIHPLIQSWSRDMDPSASQHYKAMALQVITTGAHTENKVTLYRHLLPHLSDLVEQPDGQPLHVNDLMAAGKIFVDQGHYQKAVAVFRAALGTIGRSGGATGENIRWVKMWLARSYHDEGQLDESERLQVEVLEELRNSMGARHPDTITAAASLANTYREQGRWAEAEVLEMDVLELRRNVQGREHPDSLAAAANLAATYSAQGRWGEAESLRLEVLEKYRMVLGEGNLETITAAANLAVTYWMQGRWDEAEMLTSDVLEKRKRILGKTHPETLRVATNLAAIYHQQGRWDEAGALSLEVLEQRRKVQGKEHPDTVEAEITLAATYREQGRLSEAETLGLHALEQRRSNLGREHPDTLSAARQLSLTYYAQGRLSEAEAIGQEVLESRINILGREHPHSIDAAAGLAATYVSQGRLEAALQFLSPAVQLSLGVIGREHPNTQKRVRDLILLYENLGKEREAQETKALLIS